MKMKSKYKNLVLILLSVTLFTVSCKKNKNSYIDYNPAVTASQEFASNQQMMTQILNTYFKSLTDSLLWADGTAIVDGATVSIKDSPVVMMEINYNSWGNYDGYGHFRQGIIEALPETDFMQANVLVNFNFDNFLFDKDTLLVDAMSVLHVSESTQAIRDYEVTIDSAVMIYSDTTDMERYSFNMNQVFSLKKDPDSSYTSTNDEILISGTMNGITYVNNTYNALITDSSALVDTYDCHYLKGGPVSLQVADFTYPAVIYYPDTCDNSYTIEIDGNPFPFPFDFN